MTAVRVGMSPAEVRSLVGAPASVSRDEEQLQLEYWHYRDGLVILMDGKVRYSFPEAPAQPGYESSPPAGGP